MFYRTRRTLVLDCKVASCPGSFPCTERGNEPGDEPDCKEEENQAFSSLYNLITRLIVKDDSSHDDIWLWLNKPSYRGFAVVSSKPYTSVY